MKKYRFNKLTVEITRRCNKKCVHCMRGNAEDVTMDEKIIDRIFDDVRDAARIVLGNGEALLEVGKIEYFIDKLLDSQWSTREIEENP